MHTIIHITLVCNYSSRPVNLLQSTPERWVYVLMFGAISGELLVSILSNGFGFTDLANSSVVGSSKFPRPVFCIYDLNWFTAHLVRLHAW